MRVIEIFASIQGEGRYIGRPQVFVRLAGCNLRCRWCDTKYSYGAGREMTAAEVIKRVKAKRIRSVCVTGGEPMLQADELRKLVGGLKRMGCTVILQTNGTLYDERIFRAVDCVAMDMKPPSSGEKSDESLLAKLKAKDQVKVVVTDGGDLAYARRIIRKSPAEVVIQPASGADAGRLAKRALSLRLDARILPQMHKMLNIR